jgi:hypothetical protein
MNPTMFQQYLAELARGYATSGFAVLDTVERVMGEILGTRYRREEIRVRIDSVTLEVVITAYSQTQGGHQRTIALSSLTGVRNLQKHIGQALENQHTMVMARQLEAYCKGGVYQGVVRRVAASGGLWAELALNEGVRPLGWCGPDHQLRQEVGHVRVGQRLSFYLKRVETLLLDGTVRLHLVLDRRCKALLQKLFLHQMKPYKPQIKVTCRNRRAGTLSELWSNEFIPKTVRDEISRELGGEKIQIYVGKNREEVVAARRRLTRQARRDVSEGASRWQHSRTGVER